MDKKELEFILQEGEGLKIEFKEKVSGLDKEIVAFSNVMGGRIFLGVNDNSETIGINVTNELKSQVQSVARNCDPSIDIDLEKFEDILIIEVKEGEDKPYRCKEGFYFRQGASSQKMSRDEIINLVIGEGKIRFDELINKNFNFKEDFDEEKFLEFLKKANISQVISLREILMNLSLGNKIDNRFSLNNAGVLLFAKNPENFFRQNFITCVLYKGNERVNVIDRKDFKNNLLSNYNDSFNFLKQHLRLEYIIKGFGPRQEVLEIPEEALKEVLLNSIIHRDYFEKGAGIFVEVFDNRVEIYNKGKLLFDKKELGKISISRNPILFDIFHRIGLIEKIGSGINRIKKLIKDKESKVSFETNGFFRVIFERPIAPQVTPQVTPQVSLTDLEMKILNLVKKDNKISRKKISEVLGIKEDTVKEYLKKLREKKVLKRMGETSAGYWEVIKKDGKDK